MTTRTKKRTWFVVLAFMVMALLAGVAVAHEGYGVGDGTGPVAEEPQDGTGEQHRGPAHAIVVSPDAESTLTEPLRDRDQLQDRDQLRDQDETCDQEQLQDRDRLREQDQDRLREQDQLHDQDGI